MLLSRPVYRIPLPHIPILFQPQTFDQIPVFFAVEDAMLVLLYEWLNSSLAYNKNI